MASSNYSIHITSSTEREAILDCVYRLVDAYDKNDLSLHDSAWLTSSTPAFILHGNTLTGMDAIREPFHLVGPMNTTHMVTNPRVIHKQGEERARVTATVLAQHYRAGEGRKDGADFYLAGCFYDLDVVFDGTDGLWKAERFLIDVVWNQGDRTIVQPGRDLLEM